MATAYIPAIYFYYDITFNERKAESSILVGLFGEDGLRKFLNFSDKKRSTFYKFHLTLFIVRDLNLCVCFTLTGMVTFFVGRVLFFHNLNIWAA
jgi:hypothetical protein